MSKLSVQNTNTSRVQIKLQYWAMLRGPIKRLSLHHGQNITSNARINYFNSDGSLD